MNTIESNNYYYYNKPKIILSLSRYIINNIIYIYYIVLFTSMYIGIYVVDSDFQQGEHYRMIYIHVTSAWNTILLYIIASICSVIYIINRSPIFSIIARKNMEIGLLFSLITLITGSLWGKTTWGTWWVWDARLTSVLILAFIYLTYIIISYMIQDNSYNNYILSVYIIIGLGIIPIIKKSVDWWNTLHQASSMTQIDNHIHISILIPLLLVWLSSILVIIIYNIYSIRLDIVKKRTFLYLK